ncbi:MAG: biotin--[acetyl-CoA-carboxylase] ligase [Dysgonamonadaceae bacterium]|jgi:BirA family biotin operon repressor/biotin-[acetyl-CoA-carboxylase] ligase|nr:biotin--[acetyl-CoA-carboxylase] ligase [Dysgonamonadaceae bacterium]
MSNIIKIKETDSTNHWLQKQSEKQTLDEGVAVAAQFQTVGKGQRGNHWESEAGKNILCSMILYPEFLPVKQQFLLSETVALGLKDAMEQYISPVKIKWPNDIYYKDKKIAGILIENELSGQITCKSIVGVGLNVNQEQFSPAAPKAVSMKQILGKETEPDTLLEQTVNAVLFRYNTLKSGNSKSIASAYHNSLYRKSDFHPFTDRNGAFIAEINRVADDGLLHLITNVGEKRCYAFKEVGYV